MSLDVVVGERKERKGSRLAGWVGLELLSSLYLYLIQDRSSQTRQGRQEQGTEGREKRN